MGKHKSITVSFVSNRTTVRRSNKIKPMHDQQHYQRNSNQRLPNKQKQSSHSPSFLVNDIRSSNNQFRETSPVETNIPVFATPERFSQFKNSNPKNVDANRKSSCSNGWLIFFGILFTAIALTAMIIALYLVVTITTTTSTTSTTTTYPLIQITQPGDPIFGIYDTTAGQSTGGFNGRFSVPAEEPPMAIDGLLTTKYLNFGNNGSGNANISQVGINTGFYVTPNISNASVVCGLLFGTAMDTPLRDPIAVTLEGTNSTALNSSSSWTLIYSGPTGIDPVNTPNRSTYGTLQVFSNTIAYQSYRLLITSQRAGYSNAVQYSEAQLMGYY